MTQNETENGEGVSVSMELTGEYGEVMSKLSMDVAGERDLSALHGDLEAILDTIERIDGGTRSAVASNLPADMTVEYDAEGVVTVLQVLEQYGFVTLEGNTWYPGARAD